MLPVTTGRSRARSAVGLLAALSLGLAALSVQSPAADAASAAAGDASPTTLPGGLDLATASIAELQAGLTAGTFTSVQLTRAYLARIDAINYAGPRLNAVRQVSGDAIAQAEAADAARRAGQARGPLAGIPLLIKDNIDQAGLPTTAGSVALANSFPRADAPLTASLKAAGAIVLGKTNLTEFANYLTSGMPAGYSSLGGQVLNANDLSQTPSGSSAGSGVAASVALAAGTVGTETSGSILSPANANALVGIKPTVGLISRTGVIPISATQDTAGPMTRYVGDAAAVLTGLTTGIDPEDPATTARAAEFKGVDYTASLSTGALRNVRLGVIRGNNPDPVYAAALAELTAQGATLVDVTAPAAVTAPGILDREFKRDLNAYLSRLPATAPIKTLADVIAFNNAHADVALKFGQTLAIASQAVDLSNPQINAQYVADRDAGLTQSRANIDAVLSTNNVQAIVSNAATTGIGARAGYPSLTMPAGYNANNRRPVPITFLGTAYTEQRLIGFASDLEAALGAWRSPQSINPTAFACTPLASPNSSDACDQPADATPGTGASTAPATPSTGATTTGATTTGAVGTTVRGKAVSLVAASAVRNPVRAGSRARLRVLVAAGASRPTGRVVARYQGRKIGSGRLNAAGRGTFTVRVPAAGSRKIKVIYQGDGAVNRSVGTVTLRSR